MSLSASVRRLQLRLDCRAPPLLLRQAFPQLQHDLVESAVSAAEGVRRKLEEPLLLAQGSRSRCAEACSRAHGILLLERFLQLQHNGIFSIRIPAAADCGVLLLRRAAACGELRGPLRGLLLVVLHLRRISRCRSR